MHSHPIRLIVEAHIQVLNQVRWTRRERTHDHPVSPPLVSPFGRVQSPVRNGRRGGVEGKSRQPGANESSEGRGGGLEGVGMATGLALAAAPHVASVTGSGTVEEQAAGVGILLQISMLVLSFVLGHILRRRKFYYIPEASGSLLIGPYAYPVRHLDPRSFVC